MMAETSEALAIAVSQATTERTGDFFVKSVIGAIRFGTTVAQHADMFALLQSRAFMY